LSSEAFNGDFPDRKGYMNARLRYKLGRIFGKKHYRSIGKMAILEKAEMG